MLKSSTSQGSFYDTDYICEQLIPPDSFYRKFRDTVWPLIDDKHFDEMYCKDNGRPPITPSLLAMATIIQFYKNLSDREMERACMFDIEVKYALGLKLDERPFDHSSLGDFRKRLLEHGKEKEIFDRILKHLVKARLVKRNEIQRIDATHILADVAIPTVVALIKKGTYEITKTLGKRHSDALERISKTVDLSEYDRNTVNKDIDHRADLEKKKKYLVDVVKDAKTILNECRNIKGDKILTRRIDILKRILRENVDDDKANGVREKKYKDKPGDLLVSPIDTDARYGAKSTTKRFTGFKANISETVESRFITNITTMPGNKHDGTTTVETVMQQKKVGLKPKGIIGDTAYGTGAQRKELEAKGVRVIAPLSARSIATKDVYPKSMFKYNEKKDSLTCPAGVTTTTYWLDRKKEIKVFHFAGKICRRCRRRQRCTKAEEGRRTVGIGPANRELMAAEKFNRTKEFKKLMKLRPAVEGKLSELVRYHGMRRARYRGLKKVGLQCYFTAAAVNIKRWFKVMSKCAEPRTDYAPA